MRRTGNAAKRAGWSNSVIDSRKLDDLLPEVAEKARQFLAICAAEGCDVRVTSTYRDYERQNALYAQGRTRPGAIVTKARAGYSAHNFRRAFDVVPLDQNGKPWWKAPNDVWNQLGLFGRQCGLEWGGAWKTFKDKPHFQDLGGKTLAQLRAAHSEQIA